MCQARHLVSKERKPNGDDKPLAADVVWVLMSINGKHHTTEACRDIEHPSWQRAAIFDVDLREPGEISKDSRRVPSSTTYASRDQQLRQQKKNNSASATLDQSTTARLAPSATAIKQTAGKRSPPSQPPQPSNPFAEVTTPPETQSLNPFASNFVPPPSSQPSPPKAPPAPPPSRPAPPARLRTSLVLHLRVLNGRLSAKEVLGDVAVDLVPLLKSGGERLATDRLGWLGSEDYTPLERLVADADSAAAPLAVDTWVSLRQGTADLRVQICVKPVTGLRGGCAAAAAPAASGTMET